MKTKIEVIGLDSSTFYNLICQHKMQLYKIAYSYFNNEADALEAIQETTYRAFNSLHRLKQQQYFKTWLIRILINYCIDENKRKGKEIQLTDNKSEIHYEDIDSKIELSQALSRLNAKYKTIIILKYFEDMTLYDIAAIMDKPLGTIKTWLNKALCELRIILNEEGNGNAKQGREASFRVEGRL